MWVIGNNRKEDSYNVRTFNLREREAGYTHILLKKDVEKLFPYMKDYWKVAGHLMSRPVGGESLLDVIEKRLKPFLAKIWKRYAGKKVWFVTHGRTIQCLRYILDDFTLEGIEAFLDEKDDKGRHVNTPKNGSVTTYLYDPETGKLKLSVFNKVYWTEDQVVA